MTTAWAGFYQQYQPLVDFIKQLETEMEAYTPPVNDILAMQKTVEKLKVNEVLYQYSFVYLGFYC